MEVGGQMLRSHNLAYSGTGRYIHRKYIYIDNNIYTEERATDYTYLLYICYFLYIYVIFYVT